MKPVEVQTPQPPTTLALPRWEPAPTSSYALLAVASDGRQLVAAPSPDRRTADGYLRLTAHILLQSERLGFRTIGVMSAHADEGKTVAAINLAVCLGRAKGRSGRVLLVDGDMRTRALSRTFCGPDPESSTSTESRHPMLVGTALEGVDLMTAPPTGDCLSVSAPSAWVATFNRLGAVYPHIVIDCPAVLEEPEGMVLRECVEQLVLVVRAGRTPRRLVARALGNVGSRVLGVILHGSENGVAHAERRR